MNDLLHVRPGAARVDALGEEGVHAGRVAIVKVGEQVLQVVVVVVAVLEVSNVTTRGFTNPLFTGSESGSGIIKRMKI